MQAHSVNPADCAKQLFLFNSGKAELLTDACQQALSPPAEGEPPDHRGTAPGIYKRNRIVP